MKISTLSATLCLLLKNIKKNIYLTHVCEHHRSRESLLKRWKYKELSANTVAFISCWWVYVYSWWKLQCWLKASYIFIFSLGSLRYCDVYRYESCKCHSLPFFLTFFYYFTFPGFPFMSMIGHYKLMMAVKISVQVKVNKLKVHIIIESQVLMFTKKVLNQ